MTTAWTCMTDVTIVAYMIVEFIAQIYQLMEPHHQWNQLDEKISNKYGFYELKFYAGDIIYARNQRNQLLEKKTYIYYKTFL